jgi:hypothetical protein
MRQDINTGHGYKNWPQKGENKRQAPRRESEGRNTGHRHGKTLNTGHRHGKTLRDVHNTKIHTGMEAREVQSVGKIQPWENIRQTEDRPQGKAQHTHKHKYGQKIEMDMWYRYNRNTTETERETQRLQTNVYLNMLVTGRFEPCFNYGLSN